MPGQSAEFHILLQHEVGELGQEAWLEDRQRELTSVILDGERDIPGQGPEESDDPLQVHDARSDAAGECDHALIFPEEECHILYVEMNPSFGGAL